MQIKLPHKKKTNLTNTNIVKLDFIGSFYFKVHREVLSRCVEQIKDLAPILICSMKIFIQIISQVNNNI